MTDDAEDQELVTITQAADRAGVARSTIRRALDRGVFPGASRADDQSRTWQIPTVELDQAGYRARQAEPDTDDQPQAVPLSTPQAGPSASTLELMDKLGPLFERVSNAERDRADAQADARSAVHRLEVAGERIAELETASTAGRPWIVWALIAATLVGALVGAAVTILIV